MPWQCVPRKQNYFSGPVIKYSSSMYQLCIKYVSVMHQVCIQYASSMHPVGIKYALIMHQAYFKYAYISCEFYIKPHSSFKAQIMNLKIIISTTIHLYTLSCILSFHSFVCQSTFFEMREPER